jgi:multiple sugar transport system permease protein
LLRPNADEGTHVLTSESTIKPNRGGGGPSKQKNAWLLHVFLLLASVLFLFPLVWLISTSLKRVDQAMQMPPTWIPHPVVWQNYYKAFMYHSDKVTGEIPFLEYACNTVVLAVLTVAGAVCSNALVAYAFARLRWKGRDVAFALTIATMMVPFPVTMVPIYALYKDLGWIGSFKPLWVGFWFGGAFNIFLLRQFFRTIPFELSEAAKIDGCSEFEIFRLVILPLAKPALAVVALFTFLGTWNDFLGPLIYLVKPRTFTLGLGLQAFQSQHGGTPWNLMMAATAMVIAPVIILFFFAQKQFIQGIAVTGLKG